MLCVWPERACLRHSGNRALDPDVLWRQSCTISSEHHPATPYTPFHLLVSSSFCVSKTAIIKTSLDAIPDAYVSTTYVL
jgi:hypothetical protein